MNICQEEKLMGHLGVVLYEYLGEEYPEVLGSILGALKAIVNVIGMTKMTPPIKDLLPRLTPILKNRYLFDILKIMVVDIMSSVMSLRFFVFYDIRITLSELNGNFLLMVSTLV